MRELAAQLALEADDDGYIDYKRYVHQMMGE
jgi:hypothetical protein